VVTTDRIVERVCRLPIDFDARRTASVADLVRESGYVTARAAVTVERLGACLAEHPDWVEAWFQWSADNRSTPAWYVTELPSGGFELGYHDGPDSPPPVVLADRVPAAAAFVRRHLDHVAGLPLRAGE
jgi:hypothetical protein